MFTSLNLSAIRLSLPFKEGLELARDHGFEALDPPLSELLQVSETMLSQEIKDRFSSAGVHPGGWLLTVDFNGSEEKYQADIEALPRYAQLAQALGSPWCMTWIRSYSNEFDYDAYMDFHIRRLRPAAQILADHGCRLGLEFLGPRTLRAAYKYEFISTIDGALALAANIGTGNVGLLLDSWHWYTSRATIDDILRLTAEQVIYVHVNDAPADRTIDEQIDTQRLLPGASGVIDLSGFLRSLAQIGYSGPVVVEPFNAELTKLPPAERVRTVKASLDTAWTLAGLKR